MDTKINFTSEATKPIVRTKRLKRFINYLFIIPFFSEALHMEEVVAKASEGLILFEIRSSSALFKSKKLSEGN